MLEHFGSIASEKRLKMIWDDLTNVVETEQDYCNTKMINADSRIGDVSYRDFGCHSLENQRSA